MSLVKYRLKEVASDFGVTPKEIAEIISKFYEKPKSNTQALTDEELNVVFDCMTQNHQIQSLEQVFAMAKPKEQPKAEPAKPAAEQPRNAAPQQNNQNRPQGGNRPQGQNNQQPRQNNNQQPRQNQQPQQPQQPAKQPEPERKRERRVVDTSAVQVNANRFADVDNLVSERVQDYQGGKQKIGGKKGQQQNKKENNKFKGNKARNEEQEKMRRLQMEVARKAPTVVKIPDEITVS